jgi:phosphatidylglycerol:prolipoprotein diacylglycerol transferase
MRPTLVSFSLGEHEFALHAYGFLVGLGFAVAIIRLWRVGRRMGMDGGRLLDLAFWGLVAGVVGSRVAFVALNARLFVNACVDPTTVAAGGQISGCLAAFRFWEGGLVFYGGGVGAGLVALWFCRREGWSLWKLGDLAAPTLAIGHALGRLGCYLAGCCFGAACHAPWGAAFPRGSVAFDEIQAAGGIASGAAFTPALHPTQLYEALGEFALFAVLLWLDRPRERSATEPGPGRLLGVYLVGYACLRFVVEIFRGDAARGYLFEWTSPRIAAALRLPADHPLLLSASQLGSLLLLVGVAIAWARRRRDAMAVDRAG